VNIQDNGIEIIDNFLPQEIIDEIILEVSSYGESDSKHGIRNVEKKISTISNLINSNLIQSKAEEVLGSKPMLVRAIFFDKTPEKNWLVTWHQDKTISVNTKIDISGWGPWSIKDNVNHVQPDLSVLNQMVTFRLHLDEANENNGCLKVIPNSHQKGVIKQSDIGNIVNAGQPLNCIAKAGDLVLMRPHILHSSSKSTQPSHRRVVHLEFSSYNLPTGLKWA
jgi:ectoine hydroxylase-related dioxygenase (phytanoyl-CoA dioxygenase family)